MRNIFLLLLFINVAFYLWGYQKSNSSDKRLSTAPSDVPTLMLLGERPEHSSPQEPSTEEVELQTSTINIAAVQQEPTLISEPMLIPISELETEVAPEVVPEVTPEVGMQGDEVTAVDEMTVLPEAVTPNLDLVKITPTSEAAKKPALFCFKTGFMQSEDAIVSIEQALLSNGIGVKREKTVADVRVGYWVLIPSSADRTAALKMVERLKEEGITDVRRFIKGALVNAISLGLFRKKEYAVRRSEIIQTKGFETKIVSRMRSKDGYILHIESTEKRFPEMELWSGMRKDRPTLQLQQEPCSGE
ncbi:MAG: hypothetical protein L3J28_10010 [Candidatus Polarisedimenticolaceae bacterium]|nr:hypothetical protein [Candidatus Polarisedimenticolaceae bacterium]